MRATQRIFITKEATRLTEATRTQEANRGQARERESRNDWQERQEKSSERHALEWLYKSEIDVDREKVLTLFGDVLRRYWGKCGYSQKWIDKQFCSIDTSFHS